MAASSAAPKAIFTTAWLSGVTLICLLSSLAPTTAYTAPEAALALITTGARKLSTLKLKRPLASLVACAVRPLLSFKVNALLAIACPVAAVPSMRVTTVPLLPHAANAHAKVDVTNQ
jgi:hypothetical protein